MQHEQQFSIKVPLQLYPHLTSFLRLTVTSMLVKTTNCSHPSVFGAPIGDNQTENSPRLLRGKKNLVSVLSCRNDYLLTGSTTIPACDWRHRSDKTALTVSCSAD